MKFKLVSDLHLEGSSLDTSKLAFDENGDMIDVLILAGDIAVTPDFLARHVHNIPSEVQVLYVPGNHEYEVQVFNDVLSSIKEMFPEDNWHILNNETFIFGSTRFLCSTLWSDLKGNGDSLFEANYEQAQLILKQQRTKLRLEDGSLIPFDVEHMLAEFNKSKEFLKREIDKPFDGTTVVITHFAPNLNSSEKKYKLNGFWASNLTDIMSGVDIWCHGHIHSTSDYKIDNTRIIANPRGVSLIYDLNQNLSFDINQTIQSNVSSHKKKIK